MELDMKKIIMKSGMGVFMKSDMKKTFIKSDTEKNH